MPNLRLTCPFCCEPTRLEILPTTAVRKPLVEDVKERLPELLSDWKVASDEQMQNVLRQHYFLFHALAHCQECNEHSVLKALILSDPSPIQKGSEPGVDFGAKITVLRHLPELESNLPTQVPEEIAQVLKELDEDHRRGRNAGRILGGCRTVLDVALQRLDPGATGSRADRISKLHKAGLLTTDIAEWAKQLWKDGHDGVHELKAEGHPVSEHIKFLRLFVEVAFVMPDRVRAGKLG